MQDWQQRVITERDELKDKYDKLTAFLQTDAVPTRDLLARQWRAMGTYLEVLNERIALFT